MHTAAIDPGKSIAYRHKQSKMPQLDGVLPLRWIAAGPSGAGKGVTMQNLILKHFRGCWERIYVFSPTAVLDKSTWDPVRKYIKENLNVGTKKEPDRGKDKLKGIKRAALALGAALRRVYDSKS